MSPVRTRVKGPDEICAQAVELARAAAVDVAGASGVGGHAGAHADAERVVTHLFECLDASYRGWRWAVTVARAARAKNVTVSEIALLPGPDSLLAPDWVPWRERLRPGDIGVGDIMPAPPDDERLAPAAALEGDDGLTDWDEDGAPGAGDMAVPLPGEAAPGGAGGEAPRRGPREARLIPPQARVLSAIGRDDAALRWYAGEHGPGSPLAHAAPGRCGGCGFYVRLSGPLGHVFGVCANEYAPDDGRVVSLDHGCGAHSEGLPSQGASASLPPVIDELGYDLVDRPGVSVEETDFEPLAGG